MFSQKFSTTNVINLDDVKLIIQRAIDNPAEIIKYQLRPFSSEKIGFTGSHQCLEVTIKRKNSHETEKLSFFAKVVPEGPQILLDSLVHLQFFDKEVEFFDQIATRLLKYAVSTEPWAPRCFLAKENVIVQEDLRAKGFALRSDVILFDGETLRSVARAQARFHAASLITESLLKKEQGKTFKDLAPKACTDIVFSKISKDNGYFYLVFDWVQHIAMEHGRKCHDLPTIFERVYSWMHYSKGKNCVICHGDTWAYNMMFDKSDPSKCLLVDFQVTRYAARAYDLAQMIYLTTTLEMREKEEATTVEAYHLEFCDILRKNGWEPISTLLELREEYEEARLAALFGAAVYYPFLFLSKEVHDNFKSPDELYTKYIYRQNNEAVYELLDRDVYYYRARLTELALELIENCDKAKKKMKND